MYDFVHLVFVNYIGEFDIKDILKNKELTIKQIALETNVSRSTIYKVLKLHLGYKSDFSLKKGNHYDEFSENK